MLRNMKTDRSLLSVSCYTRRSFSYSLFFVVSFSMLLSILYSRIFYIWTREVLCFGGKTSARTSAPAQLGVAEQPEGSGQ